MHGGIYRCTGIYFFKSALFYYFLLHVFPAFCVRREYSQISSCTTDLNGLVLLYYVSAA